MVQFTGGMAHFYGFQRQILMSECGMGHAGDSEAGIS